MQVCTICTHSAQAAIHQAIAGGQPMATVARAYGVSRSALRRHAARHLSQISQQEDVPAAAATPVAAAPAVAREPVVGHFEKRLARLEAQREQVQARIAHAREAHHAAQRAKVTGFAAGNAARIQQADADAAAALQEVMQGEELLATIGEAVAQVEQELSRARAERERQWRAHWRAVSARSIDLVDIWTARLLAGHPVPWPFVDRPRPRAEQRVALAQALQDRFPFPEPTIEPELTIEEEERQCQ